MEVDPPASPENSNLVAAGSISLEQQGPTQTQQVIRSYECTFCKRGFSNAQALGGHMNIHRRDRAKLKEPSTITTEKDLISFSPPSLLPVVSIEPGSLELESSTEDKVCTLRQPGPWPISGEFRQLQLFDERPSSSTEIHKSSSDENETQATTDELDLELRLGHES